MSQLTGYLAAKDLIAELRQEIALYPDLVIQRELNDLIVVSGPIKDLCWSQNTWIDIQSRAFQSITEAAKILKAHSKFWAQYGVAHFRRGELIQNSLPKWKITARSFLGELPKYPLSSFCLEDSNTLWFSACCSSPFPNGQIQFIEDKTNPPSRAYLKLWEIFTLSKKAPKAGEICVDLGSSPGGWTWVLANCGAIVTSVDKAELAPQVLKMKNVHAMKKDAFSIRPGDLSALGIRAEKIDWLCSDIICYPAKLYELILSWIESGRVKNFVITIKFQGETDFATLAKFRAISGSRLQHLCHNKHEVTWSYFT